LKNIVPVDNDITDSWTKAPLQSVYKRFQGYAEENVTQTVTPKIEKDIYKKNNNNLFNLLKFKFSFNFGTR